MAMRILVCVKRVPDMSENEIAIAPDHLDIERDDLVYSINEPDNYAAEEAIQIAAKVGGEVTVATIGDEEDEEVLRREMAMGAKNGVLISDDPAFAGSDGRGVATILAAFAKKGRFDLILTGVQADSGGGQVGGMLAAMLDYPYASLVNRIELLSERRLRISREIEGGAREISEIDLPCVLSIQTGINEPRYVGMRGIRQVASIPIPTLGLSELGVAVDHVGTAAAQVKRVDYFVPSAGNGARILSGSMDHIADEVMDLLVAKGGLK